MFPGADLRGLEFLRDGLLFDEHAQGAAHKGFAHGPDPART